MVETNTNKEQSAIKKYTKIGIVAAIVVIIAIIGVFALRGGHNEISADEAISEYLLNLLLAMFTHLI